MMIVTKTISHSLVCSSAVCHSLQHIEVSPRTNFDTLAYKCILTEFSLRLLNLKVLTG